MSASSPGGRKNEEKKGSFRFPAELLYFPLEKLKTTGQDLSAPGCIVRRPSACLLHTAAALRHAAETLSLAKCELPHSSAPMSASIPAPRPSSRQCPATSHSSRPCIPRPPRAGARMDAPQYDSTAQPVLLQKRPCPPSRKHPRMREMALEPKHQRQTPGDCDGLS